VATIASGAREAEAAAGAATARETRLGGCTGGANSYRAAFVTPPDYISKPISFWPKPHGLDVEN
jgi:hypothetical protein